MIYNNCKHNNIFTYFNSQMEFLFSIVDLDRFFKAMKDVANKIQRLYCPEVISDLLQG